MNNHKLCLFLLLIFLSRAQAGLAQENSSLGNLKKSFMEKAPASNQTVNTPVVSKPEIEQLAQQLGVDYETATMVSSLKNPFIPQIPSLQKVQPVEPKEEPIEMVDTPYIEPQAPPPTFTVSGMVWNTSKPVAIINGHILKVGDEISNWQIRAITKEGVRVTFQDQELWVKPRIEPEKQN